MNILTTNYVVAELNESQNLLTFIWLPSTANMLESEFVNEIERSADLISRYKPSKILLQSQSMGFIISSELQTKANEIFLPVYNGAGVKKLAILVSTEIFAYVSIQQTVEENIQVHKFETRYFVSEVDARKWLNV